MDIDNGTFSERERDVIRLLLEGKGNKQIAFELGISRRTVEFHLSNIYAKMGVTSRSEAILKLTESHLRNSADEDLRQTTVHPRPESNHTSGISILMKRISMNKSILIGFGLVTITSVFCMASLYQMAAQRASEQQVPSDVVSTATVLLTPTELPASPTSVPMRSPTNIPIPAHTVNGYTASIESYYVDTSHVIFHVRITGGDMAFGHPYYYDRIGRSELYDESGAIINSSGGWGPAPDPILYQFEFVPVTLLKGDRIKGQFAFDLENPPDYTQTLAQFRFNFDLPIYPEMRFYPKQVITANGLEMLLDSVTVTPTFTQAYLCFSPPSFGPWTIGSQSTLQIGEQIVSLYNFRLLFDATLGGDRRAGSEPYWVPPTKNGSCTKIGFQAGRGDPTSFTLTIPELEKLEPDILMTAQLSKDYPGLDAKEAYQTYLEEHGNVYKGPWIFNVELTP